LERVCFNPFHGDREGKKVKVNGKGGLLKGEGIGHGDQGPKAL